MRLGRTLAPGVSPVMVVLGELAVTVTAGPLITGVAVKVYCSVQTAKQHQSSFAAMTSNNNNYSLYLNQQADF